MVTEYLLPELRRGGGRAARGRRRRDGRGDDGDAGRARRRAGRRRGSSASRARDSTASSARDGRTVARRDVTLARSPRWTACPRWPRPPRRSAGRRCATWRRSAATCSSAAPYGDVGVALLALGAEVDARRRTVPIDASGTSSGRARTSSGRSRSTTIPSSVYVRWARRAANSPAVVCVAVAGGRVAFGGVAAHPVRSPGAEAHLDDPAAAGAAAAAEIDPPTDAIASALVPPAHDRAVRAPSPGGAPCRLRSSSSSSTGARPR